MSESASLGKRVASFFLVTCLLISQFFFIGNATAAKRTTTKISHNQMQKGNAVMGDSTNSTNENKNLRFMFITPFIDINFFKPVKKGMADAAKQMGVSCEFTGPTGGETEIQAQMVRQAIADGYDGIALNIIDSAGLAEVLNEASDAGIPVVAFNVDDKSVPVRRLCAVNQNLFEAGKVLGKESHLFIDEGSKILILMHDEGVSALDERCRGITEGLKGRNITWEVIVSGSAENTEKIVTKRLKAEPDIRAVLCTGQSDTEGAGFAIERNFKGRDYKVAGFDLSAETLRMVKEGTISFVIDQQPYVQGYYPVVQLTHYLRYGIVPSNIDAGYNIINQQGAVRVIELSEKYYR